MMTIITVKIRKGEICTEHLQSTGWAKKDHFNSLQLLYVMA